MSDKDLIQEAIDYARRYWQHGSETRTQYVLKVLADALEARQVDEAALAEVIFEHRYKEFPNGVCACGVDSVAPGRRHEEHMARAVVEFLGERHDPEPIKCDYCGDDLPSVKHRSHLPTTPDLQRRGFAADKIVCGNCAKSPSAPQPSESLVCEPRQDSMLLWEGTSSAPTYPANEHDDAEESEAEYKDHAATVASEPEWEYRATTDNGAFVGESRTTPEHAVQALQEAVDEYPIVLDEQGVKVERRPRSPWLPVEGGSK